MSATVEENGLLSGETKGGMDGGLRRRSFMLLCFHSIRVFSLPWCSQSPQVTSTAAPRLPQSPSVPLPDVHRAGVRRGRGKVASVGEGQAAIDAGIGGVGEVGVCGGG